MIGGLSTYSLWLVEEIHSKFNHIEGIQNMCGLWLVASRILVHTVRDIQIVKSQPTTVQLTIQYNISSVGTDMFLDSTNH